MEKVGMVSRESTELVRRDVFQIFVSMSNELELNTTQWIYNQDTKNLHSTYDGIPHCLL